MVAAEMEESSARIMPTSKHVGLPERELSLPIETIAAPMSDLEYSNVETVRHSQQELCKFFNGSAYDRRYMLV